MVKSFGQWMPYEMSFLMIGKNAVGPLKVTFLVCSKYLEQTGMICICLLVRSSEGSVRFENTSVIGERLASGGDRKEGVIFRILIAESKTGILEFRCEEVFKCGTQLADDLHANQNHAASPAALSLSHSLVDRD